MKSIYGAWLEWVRSLYTGYFACVMATGIVSVALLLSKALAVSLTLWVVGFVLLGIMTIVYGIRVALFRRELALDVYNPRAAFGFFTFVAALGVMATRSSLGGWSLAPAALTAVEVIAWFALIYWIFAMMIFTNEKPVEQSVNGAWLITVVATESLAITWVFLTPALPSARATLQLLSYAFWTFGVLLYLIFIALIIYRFFFFRVTPGDLAPPYWISMGAMAITTVAGVRLLNTAAPSSFLVAVRPYIEGFTVMMWAWGTWWIPLLLIIGIWKYLVNREPIRYDPALWSVVFPLGMYSTSLQLLTRIPGLEFLAITGAPSAWLAFAAWALTLGGWLWAIGAGARRALADERTVSASQSQDTGIGEIG
jgi:tellurite resistance protein TehA-like permease